MNFMLIEFFGPHAPQPSAFGWSVFWTSVFIIRNAELNLEFDRLRSWVSGEPRDASPLEEIRELRRELRDSTQWIEEEINAYHTLSGFTGVREDDVGEAARSE